MTKSKCLIMNSWECKTSLSTMMKFLGSRHNQINASMCLRIMLKEWYFGEIEEIAYLIFLTYGTKLKMPHTHTHTEIRNQSATRPLSSSSSSNSMIYEQQTLITCNTPDVTFFELLFQKFSGGSEESDEQHQSGHTVCGLTPKPGTSKTQINWPIDCDIRSTHQSNGTPVKTCFLHVFWATISKLYTQQSIGDSVTWLWMFPKAFNNLMLWKEPSGDNPHHITTVKHFKRIKLNKN